MAGRRVLIVDDDEGCGRLLALLVQHMGHAASYITDPHEALEHIWSNPPDLLILDVMMPNIDGVEVLRRIRKEPKTARLPVIVFSALADAQFRQWVRSIGANDYWVKASIDFQDLEHRLQPFLQTAQQQN